LVTNVVTLILLLLCKAVLHYQKPGAEAPGNNFLILLQRHCGS
jgi:hypothetical protein